MANGDIGGVWRTVGGRRIFIKNGQDLATAMKESEKFSNSVQKNYKKLTDEEINNLQKSSDECYNKLNSDEKEAMYEYCMGGYQDINDYLNGKFEGYETLNDAVHAIDGAMMKYELEEDVTVYRKTDSHFYENYKTGDIFQEKMYYSTSLSKDIADIVSDYHENPVTVEIKVPKGTKSIYVGSNTEYEFEAELLLSRNLSYKLVEKSDNNIILEVINGRKE